MGVLVLRHGSDTVEQQREQASVFEKGMKRKMLNEGQMVA